MACVEDIDYSPARNLKKDALTDLLLCNYIEHHHNVLISGATGTGKTYIACALANLACKYGYTALYYRAFKFLEFMELEKATGNYLKTLEKFANVKLLILDDLGPDVMNKQQRTIFLDIVEEQLCVVVSRRQQEKDALSWYLTNVPGSRKSVMTTVMYAYGLRWRVEEYHRQNKQDYQLEKICLRKYSSIKNMGVIVMLAASFCARPPKNLIIKLLALSNQLPRKQLSDIPDYPYYMIMAAVAKTLEMSVKQRPKSLRIRKQEYLQLKLDFKVT